MANYSSLISAMEAVIRQNGNQQITGTILQTVLRSVIVELGAEFQFGGVATPDTNPNTPDYNVAYIAGAGTYTNFDNQTIPAGKIGIFKNRGAESGTWALQTFDISLGANSVSESNIQNGAVTENKIADNSVSTDKIKNKNVTRNKLSDGLIDELDNKANINGFYSTLGAGVAENLVGRGSVPAEYTFRPSNGNADLGSGMAQIKKFMGRTLVWNQICVNGNFANTDYWSEVDATITVNSNVATIVGSQPWGRVQQSINYIEGHKYLVSCYAKGNTGGIAFFTNNFSIAFNDADKFKHYCTIRTATSNDSIIGLFSAVGTIEVKNAMLIDLTLMFGTGNEPSTVEEFEALFPLDYYAYNAGELLSVKATGIKTVGFNQWDKEQAVNGKYIDYTNGNEENSSNYSHTGYVAVLPNTNYYLRIDTTELQWGAFYDANKQFISGSQYFGNGIFTTPLNAAFVRISLPTDKINSVCINLSWSGYRNGEYEPYWESELPIPITTMTGKLNGEGESVAMFADGFKSAGTAFDEITSDKAVKRIGKVDLGTLTWVQQTVSDVTLYYSSVIADKKAGSANIIAEQYTLRGVVWQDGDMTIAVGNDSFSEQRLFLINHSKSAAPTPSDNWLSGVMLYYELATPEEYILDAEQPMNYRVDDFGTEMELPQNDDEPVTAPIRYDVQYAMNAVDTLRRLPQNYISKESFEDFLAEFDSKLGAALNATIVSTMTFNAETQKYGFNITITPNP